MLRIIGKPGGGSVALGRAVIIRVENGIPLFSPVFFEKLEKGGQWHRGGDALLSGEPMNVVLIAENAFITEWMQQFQNVKVVGLICSQPAKRWGYKVATVTGINEFCSSIKDGDLVLVDGDRGVVLVDPSGASLATYQARLERITPRRRLYLEYQHQTAQTQDGRQVRVYSIASNADEISQVVSSGADAVLVQVDPVSDTSSRSEEDQFEEIRRITDLAAGKPVCVILDGDAISSSALLRGAVYSDLTVVIPFAPGSLAAAILRAVLTEERDRLLNEQLDFGDLLIAGIVKPGQQPLQEEDIVGLDRVIVDIRMARELPQDIYDQVSSLVREAMRMLVPVEMWLPADPSPWVELGLAIGVGAMIVPPDQVFATKLIIRENTSQICRERFAAVHPA